MRDDAKRAGDALPIVIPAKAGISLHVKWSKLDPDFRQGDELWGGKPQIESTPLCIIV
jgi:hypothetical protein